MKDFPAPQHVSTITLATNEYNTRKTFHFPEKLSQCLLPFTMQMRTTNEDKTTYHSMGFSWDVFLETMALVADSSPVLTSLRTLWSSQGAKCVEGK